MSYTTLTVGSHVDAVETFHDRGWTDGLPIVPPTPDAVEEMLAVGDVGADHVLGALPQRDHELTAWQAATFAVMAGCLPSYFPVVLATWDAAFDPRFNLHAVLSSTGGSAIMGVVSGPYAVEIGMNARHSLFGPGNRANATIGRAVRLAAMVGLEATPGLLDASSFGHGGKYTMHVAEDPPPAPWSSVHEQLGFPPDATTVTILPVEGPRQIMQRLNPSPEALLRTIAACMRNPSQNGTGKGTYYVIALGPEHAGMLIDAGWSQSDVREFLGRESRITLDELAAAGVLLDSAGAYDMTPAEDGTLPVAEARNILVVTAGGAGAGWSVAIPSWTGVVNTQPITRPVRERGRAVPSSSGARDGLNYL